MEHVRDLPAPKASRRALLRGGVTLGAAAAGLAAAAPSSFGTGSGRARRASSAPDGYPPTYWTPADTANYTVSERPSSYPVQFVVVHVAQETYDDTIRLFQDPAHKASTHYVVRSADGHIGQCVRERDIAWHAGNWNYNTRSIGIEHEGWVDQPRYFTDAMYRSSAALTAAVCDRYGLPKDRDHIIGHSEVPGADHTDPGRYWDWTLYLRLVNGV
ncbi:amidase [Wenjunlia tyrosinilytica]|uniref:N-acetylmuramoyl-L-alanine amidase n=1 Tax=Wenjunlia tyrosinilytica TaxID=1544741 RepID=A0A917ZS95_9ACTN|nr:N-acetylmuramoyl-L-alanine amidase [Wenjunlia tyrosinilytica]GGO90934.1 amidase [Wenjunlia tyrosinilytica]